MAFYSKQTRNILFYAMIGKKMKVSGHFWAKDSGVCEKGQTILPLYVTRLTWLDPACKHQHSDPIICYKIHRLCTLPFKVSLGTPMERNRKRRAKSPSLAGSASPLHSVGAAGPPLSWRPVITEGKEKQVADLMETFLAPWTGLLRGPVCWALGMWRGKGAG